MPKVDFYILAEESPDAPLRFACRLAEKAVDHGHRVFIRVASSEDARRLDDLLWTFGDRSFLPHEIVHDTATAASPSRPPSHPPSHPLVRVLIGQSSPPDEFRDMVVNIGADAPNDFDSLQRIAEVVAPALKQAARERFKLYRERGVEPATHNL